MSLFNCIFQQENLFLRQGGFLHNIQAGTLCTTEVVLIGQLILLSLYWSLVHNQQLECWKTPIKISILQKVPKIPPVLHQSSG